MGCQGTPGPLSRPIALSPSEELQALEQLCPRSMICKRLGGPGPGNPLGPRS